MTPTVNRTMNRLEWTMLVSLSVLWGGSFFFTSVALRALPPLTLVLLRIGGAALILNLIVITLGMRMPRDGKKWAAFFGMGLLNNIIPFCLIVWGQTQIASGLAAILNATTPLWTVIVAHFFASDERMTPNRLTGVLIGFTGVVAMIGPTVMGGIGTAVLAQLAGLGAAVSYAFAGIYGRRFRQMNMPTLVTAAGQVTASTLILLPLAMIVDHPWTLPTIGTEVWGAVFGIAALSTALAYVLYFRILATAGATNLLLVTFLIPISAIVLGSFLLSESLSARHYVGMALIGCGLVAIDGRLPQRFMRPRAKQEPVVPPEMGRGRDIIRIAPTSPIRQGKRPEE